VATGVKKIERNTQKLDELCVWIEANLRERIGWTELTKISGLSHMEIHALFHVHKRTSPMQWIRQQRQKDHSRTNIGSGEDAVQMPSYLLSQQDDLEAAP
jgi:transcriptional regulator GlxA family with amidase domain